LQFPLQLMSVRGVVVLTESEDQRSASILFVFALIGFIWGFLVYAFPYVYQAWTAREATVVPIPWIDMNIMAERAGFGGAMLGIATDISFIATAFVLNTWTLISMIIGSFAVFFFGNWLSVKYDLAPVIWWEHRMNIPLMLQRSIMYFWGSILIGLNLAVGLIPLLRHPRMIQRAFSSMFHGVKSPIERRTEPFSFYKAILGPLAFGFGTTVALYAILVPDFFQKFFLIVIVLVVLVPLVYTFIQGRMTGETGVTGGDPGGFLNIFYLSSGYSGADTTNIWFVPKPAIEGVAASSMWLRWFKTADIADMSMREYIIMFIVLLPFGWLLSLFFAATFWSMAPIPEGYPGVAIFWPIQATYEVLWIKGIQYNLFRPDWVAGAFAVGGAIYSIGMFTPLSMVGLIAGANSPTPFASAWLFGLIVVTISKRIFGKKWWEENKQIGAAGLLVGESIAIALAIAVVLILRALWLRPF